MSRRASSLLQRLVPALGGLVLLLVLAAWVVSLGVSFDVVADVDPSRASQPPGAGALLGTDHLGRDVAWRLVTASEAFMGPGLLAAVVAAGLGLPAGALAGYLGGPVAGLVRYLFAVVSTLPRFVLVLLACAIYGAEPHVLAIAAGIAFVPGLGGAVHTRIADLRSREFVLATRAHGVRPLRTLAWHLVWVNCRALVARQVLYLFAFVLVLETTLSYIGDFGIEEPAPSWGNMLAFEFGVHDGNLWAWAAPALAIQATVAATMAVASVLQERGRD